MQMKFIDNDTIELIQENDNFIDQHIFKEITFLHEETQTKAWKATKLIRTEKQNNQTFEINLIPISSKNECEMYVVYFEHESATYIRTISFERITGRIHINDDIITYERVTEIPMSMQKMAQYGPCYMTKETGENVYLDPKNNKVYITKTYRDRSVEKEITSYILDPNTDTNEIPYLTNLLVHDFYQLSEQAIPFEKLNQIDLILEKPQEKIMSKILM